MASTQEIPKSPDKLRSAERKDKMMVTSREGLLEFNEPREAEQIQFINDGEVAESDPTELDELYLQADMFNGLSMVKFNQVLTQMLNGEKQNKKINKLIKNAKKQGEKESDILNAINTQGIPFLSETISKKEKDGNGNLSKTNS